MADLGQRLKLDDRSALWRTVDGGTYVLALPSLLRFKIAGSGSLLWEALARGTTEAELVRLIMRRYGTEESAATVDVHTFLQMCRDRGVLD